ncbi:histidine phosphatase family protein [Sulfitobacter sp. M57]|nr:histidine phosphatase family protein [Sulfitobacter sp. KE5]MDF3422069.1 histidine phosphatase family protein [Sulfitobacter sp. KE43]MDF3433134.1 histidine phosphatase family protein [Sulfitobacter sp. KE42]MDF3458774.1 histidine phosphatase family protein [Sulfitobacter sp. S74]MDF3462673.1 histidine phosphatase family protein [Sulfitobacter sp. Ks18]MDF3466573.1 histidine phosphatase family protein [Sulfitobacter sp. M05]MDF3470468.1 histidine phosphatase family protein [Sulfitobacter s
MIRHGETTANANQIIAGVTDVPLSPLGRRQAQALADQAWPDRIAVFASPMARAQDTCKLAFPGRGFVLNDGLRERNWGVFEGCPIGVQPPRKDTPEGGESWPAMLARVQQAICEICSASEDALPVLVCHSGIIRVARVLWGKGCVGDRPPNATPILFEKHGHHFEEKQL